MDTVPPSSVPCSADSRCEGSEVGQEVSEVTSCSAVSRNCATSGELSMGSRTRVKYPATLSTVPLHTMKETTSWSLAATFWLSFGSPDERNWMLVERSVISDWDTGSGSGPITCISSGRGWSGMSLAIRSRRMSTMRVSLLDISMNSVLV